MHGKQENFVEQVGSGISRIKDALKEANLPEPEFRTEGMFSLLLKRPEVQQETRRKTREKIIRLIRENEKITTTELARASNLTKKGIEYHLSKLKTEGVLERVEPAKGGYWKIHSFLWIKEWGGVLFPR